MSTECIDAKAIAAERPTSQSGTLDSSSLKVRAQNKGYMYIAPALHVDDDGFGHANTFRCNTVAHIARCRGRTHAPLRIVMFFKLDMFLFYSMSSDMGNGPLEN